MATGRDALPALKCVPASIASNQGLRKNAGANKVCFADELASPSTIASKVCLAGELASPSTTLGEIDFEDEHHDDDASSSSDSEFDEMISAQRSVRAPEAAKPTRVRPSPLVSLQFHGSNTAERSVSSTVPTKLAGATVSSSGAEESGSAHPPVRTRKLDPLMFRTSPARTGLCTSPTESTSPSEVNATSVDISEEVGSRSAKSAKTVWVGSGGRRLCASHFSSAPTKPTSMKPATLLGNRFASSRGSDAQASSSCRAHSSPLSEIVLLQKADSKCSGMAYNLVQFRASPSFSTTQDVGRRARSISVPRKTRVEGGDLQTPDVSDEPTAELILKQTFSGCSKNEVKAALRGKYSPEDIAEVLEALGLKSGKASAKKFASL